MKFVFLTFFFLTTGWAVDLVLPTDNDAIYRGRGNEFYQYVERDFDGVKSYPWQGGQYGFVRNPKHVPNGVVFTRLHEGVDIKPVHRDAKGMPQDFVRAVAVGTVVYVNDRPEASNYGRYIVIRHLWDGCPYYTLYAHLNRADVKADESVKAGQTIGLLGFTGEGINLVRAHLHFEINLFLSNEFSQWHTHYFPNEVNFHGPYNGLNLAGIDDGEYLQAAHRNPSLTIPDFLKKQEIFYRIQVPPPGPAELAKRYPWMALGYTPGKAAEISFLRTGVPVKIVNTEEKVSSPIVSWVRPVSGPIGYYTKNFIQGSGTSARLTTDGLRYLALFGEK